MSLHAHLTPDAARTLRQQRRKSTILSLLVSILTIILVGTLLGLLLVRGISIDTGPSFIIHKSPRPPAPVRTHRPRHSLLRKPAAPSLAPPRLLVAKSVSPTTIPTTDLPSNNPSTGFGSDADSGGAWGNDPGLNGDYRSIPQETQKRCDKKDRIQRLAESGGNEACEDAVLKALRWLQQNQNKDGSWGTQKPVAMTGLALLAYLGHCETPSSLEFGATVTDAMLYLANNSVKQDGKCASDLQDKHWCYEHAIAVYALSESYLFSKNLEIAPQLKEAVESGTHWILDNQTKAGGWDYAYATSNRPGDSSIVAWHLQALKAAGSTDIPFPRLKSTIKDGLGFLEKCQNNNGGFGYGLNKKPVGSAGGHFTLTGAGTLCFQQHKGTSNTNARKGIKYLTANTQFDFPAKKANLYEHYYSSQALMNHGGDEWRRYNSIVRDQLLDNQQQDGSWPSLDGPGSHSDPAYATALGTLILEVYYRYLPGTSAKK